VGVAVQTWDADVGACAVLMLMMCRGCLANDVNALPLTHSQRTSTQRAKEDPLGRLLPYAAGRGATESSHGTAPSVFFALQDSTDAC
jgi:hypothetical protein